MALAGGDIVEVAEVRVAPAVKNFYVGGSAQAILANRVDYLSFNVLDEAAYGVGIQAGYVFYRAGAFSTAVEARYTYSWDDKTLGDTGVLSGFIKPIYDFGSVKAYGLVGYSDVNVDILGTSDGFAWGLGLATDINDDFEVFADYTVNPDFDAGYGINDFDNEIVTIGLNYKF